MDLDLLREAEEPAPVKVVADHRRERVLVVGEEPGEVPALATDEPEEVRNP